jgi:hypothetical protein
MASIWLQSSLKLDAPQMRHSGPLSWPSGGVSGYEALGEGPWEIVVVQYLSPGIPMENI